MQTCDFGCGQISIHQFKSGKWGCSSSPNKCPEMRRQNAEKIRNLRAEKGNAYWYSGIPHGTGVPTGKKGKSFVEMYGEERATQLKKSISQSLKGKPGHRHSQETIELLSANAKIKKYGGYRPGSGRGKKGWYKGHFCDSSWELAYIIYCIDHKIEIRRNTEKRTYIWNNIVRIYIPDFVVSGQLIEIKGYITEQWIAKLSANPDVIVLYKKDMVPILQYVVERYGKDYIHLYEGR